MSKFTAQHFPKGTIVSTSLYTTNEEGLTFMWFGSDKPAQFTVDHVRVADTFSGRNALIVTTTKKEKPLYEGDDYLFVPRNPEKKQAIEDLLTGENLIWEIVDTLPNHIQLHK